MPLGRATLPTLALLAIMAPVANGCKTVDSQGRPDDAPQPKPAECAGLGNTDCKTLIALQKQEDGIKTGAGELGAKLDKKGKEVCTPTDAMTLSNLVWDSLILLNKMDTLGDSVRGRFGPERANAALMAAMRVREQFISACKQP